MYFNKIFLYALLLLFSLVTVAQQWQVQNLSIAREHGVLSIAVESIEIPFVEEQLKNIRYQCKTSNEFYPIHKCKEGQISLQVGEKKVNFGVSGWMDLSNQRWDISLSNTAQNLFIKSNSKDKNIIGLNFKNLKFVELQKLLPFKLDVQGDLTTVINAQITLDFSRDLEITADYQFSQVNYEETQGDYVMAEGEIKGQISIQQVTNGFTVENTTHLTKGEALAKDIYVLFDDYPVSLQSNFNVNPKHEVEKIQTKISSKEQIFINLTSPNLAFDRVGVDFIVKDIKTLHQGFLASYFEILGIEDLEIIGQTQGSIQMLHQNITSLDIDLSELFMAIESKKININDLNAQLRWQEKGKELLSQFNWDELLLAGMPIQSSKLNIYTQGQQLRLEKNSSLPIFDGSLLVNKLELDKIFDPEISIDFSGEVKPISIALITEKMGWPIMTGSISGQIPGMKKIGHSISFDGVLDIEVFDGQMQVENLSIERLFGIAPVVAGDIAFTNLNLQQITSTYDFGEVTGLVKGYISGLRITNWKADRLDAHIESIKSKGIKQTISQRAIDNISSIGGIQGALSRSFLRFFDYFRYKKIGFGCKLRNSICQMSGVNDNKENYTLIEGSGIPSINIIGFRKFIDWEIFIDRLLNAGY